MHNTQNTKQYVFLEGGLGNQLYMIAYANYLKEQGYTFVTIPELLNSRLKAHEMYYDRDQ